MSSLFSRCLALLLTVLFASMIACAGDRTSTSIPNPAVDASIATSKSEQTAVVAGGCFWGVQTVFPHVEGVISATSGDSGGLQKTAQYELVRTGETGPAESGKNTYDP